MTVTKYMWDPDFDTVMKEEDEFGVTTAKYDYEPVEFGRLISQERDEETSYYNYDGLGSATALTDANGDVTDTYEYDAWGNAIASTGSTVNPFRWVGELGYYFNFETEDYHARARVYQPVVARWSSRDPILFSDHLNLYEYVENRPIEWIDPSGQESTVLTCSRSGDDEARSYETALINIEVSWDNLGCEDTCVCSGEVLFHFHYHAEVGGSTSFLPNGKNFGLCANFGGSNNRFIPFKFKVLFKGYRNNPNAYGYRRFYEIIGDTMLFSLPCSGGSNLGTIGVATEGFCIGADTERIAQLITVRTFVTKCGRPFATIAAEELPTGAGFPKPLRCSGEPRYEPWDPDRDYE